MLNKHNKIEYMGIISLNNNLNLMNLSSEKAEQYYLRRAETYASSSDSALNNVAKKMYAQMTPCSFVIESDQKNNEDRRLTNAEEKYMSNIVKNMR